MDIQAIKANIPADPEQAFRWLDQQFPGKVVFTTSLGKEDQAVTSLIACSGATIRQATLDTGRLFPETYDVLERTINRFKVNIEVFFPQSETVEAYASEHGINAFYKSVELRKSCCHIRKIEPLQRALSGASVWVTGLRAEQSSNRSDLQAVERDALTGLIKYNPIIDWSDDRLDSYITDGNIPVNVLHAKGFPSIGCAPCTRAVPEGDHPRSGRWWWEASNKECGLHQHTAKTTST